MVYVQTQRGAAGFVRMVPDTANGGTAPTQINLRDGVTVRQDAGGGFIVRAADVPPLLSTGLIVQPAASPLTSFSPAPITMAQFQANVVAGQGAGTAT